MADPCVHSVSECDFYDEFPGFEASYIIKPRTRALLVRVTVPAVNIDKVKYFVFHEAPDVKTIHAFVRHVAEEVRELI